MPRDRDTRPTPNPPRGRRRAIWLLTVGLAAGACGAPTTGDRSAGSMAGSSVLPAARPYALPPDAMPDALRLCSAWPVPANDVRGDMVLYGESGRGDPYDGPMLGVLWQPEDQGAIGTDEHTPIRVRGRDGVAGPITVFQRAVVPEVGTMIGWHEAGRSVGLYGHHWTRDRTDELITLASSLELVDGGFRWPAAAAPAGYVQTYRGHIDALGILVPVEAGYASQYRAAGSGTVGVLNISTHVSTAADFEAFRFLALPLERKVDDHRTTLAGDAWKAGEGPAVVTWRDDDGLVVRLVGIGIDLATVQRAAAATRELTPAEWDDLVAHSRSCPDFVPGTPPG